MIKGLGTDIVEIERIERASERTPNFLDKMFLKEEQSLFKTAHQQLTMESIAGAFAAKEAMSKALGTGFRGFGPLEIEVKKDALGKPFILLHGGAKVCARERGIEAIFLSISHAQKYAVATVVVEGREENENRNEA